MRIYFNATDSFFGTCFIQNGKIFNAETCGAKICPTDKQKWHNFSKVAYFTLDNRLFYDLQILVIVMETAEPANRKLIDRKTNIVFVYAVFEKDKQHKTTRI